LTFLAYRRAVGVLLTTIVSLPDARTPSASTASTTTLYKGFVSDIQDTNMAQAATQLSLNQTQLQAALQVTAGLHQLTLLNFLPINNG
jgi:flagellin-like hook-associated protein FlgL